MRTIYIEPPAHLNSCPARKVLLERSTLVEKHKFRYMPLKENQRFLIRAIRFDDNDLWFVANESSVRYAVIQVFKKHWKEWELRIWTFD